MKIASFTAEKHSGMKIFKPVQYLHIVGNHENLSAVRVRARLVNSESGRVDEIIPFIALDVLGEVASMNEGFFVGRNSGGVADAGNAFAVNVMLHPSASIYLSNDKFLEVDIEGLESDAETTVYGIETANIDKEFVCRYNKFYMSAGELQKTFSVGENENLILPKDSFEEVSLHYHNGSTCNYLMDELKSLMMAKNDIVSVSDYAFLDGVTKAFIAQFGYRSMFGLDVSEVESFDVRRASANTAFEFILIDTLKN